MTLPILYVGMDVHKDFVVMAVFEGRRQESLMLERVPFDAHRLRRFFQRLAGRGQIRSCYEASGAGYVLQRWMCPFSRILRGMGYGAHSAAAC